MDALFVERQGLNMKKVKRMMFGGISKAVGNAARNAAAKAPVPPADVQKMMANLPRRSTVAAPSKPGMTGLGAAMGSNPAMAANVGNMLGGTRSPGAGGMTAGPKPGMTGLGAAQANPKMMSGLSGMMAGPGKGLAPSMGAGMKKGGSVSPASKRADGCAIKGKTKGKMV
jgi:hypothetical protein